MTAESVNVEHFHLNEEELKGFKQDLLATVYNQTNAQLLIYQRGICFKSAINIQRRKSSQNSHSSKTTSEYEEIMPSADILNDIKLDKELDALKNIYKVAYDELTDQADGESEELNENLKLAITMQKQDNNEVDLISKELKENKIVLRQLKEQLKCEQSEMQEKLDKKTERLEFLRDQLQNIKRINHLEVGLVEKWEQNRLSQATIVGEKEERLLMQEIIALHRRLAGEQRLIYEIESFRNNEMSELRDKITEWEVKFKDEKSKMNIKNLALTKDIADIRKSHEKHCEITEQRKIFVEEYLAQKAEEQRLYEEQRYRVECAIRIQAWWRGVMVRRGLGPYRKKSKKGKKSKGKK